MEIRFLESLLAVIDHGSIAEAARRLNLTPAGVAQQIRSLERDIGANLLTRSGRAVRPTKAAAAILERARNLIDDVRDLKSIATSDGLTGELRLGAMQTTLAGIVPDILSAMVKCHPQIKIHVIRDGSAELHRKVLSGEIDAAVTSEPNSTIPKTCAWEVLREEPFVVLTHASITERNPHFILAHQPFIRLDRSVYAGRLIDAYLRKNGIRPKQLFELDGIEAIAVMVDRGLGVAILPDWPPPWPEGLTVRKLPLPDRSFKRRIGLMWSRDSLRTGLIHAFLEQARLALHHRKLTHHKPPGIDRKRKRPFASAS